MTIRAVTIDANTCDKWGVSPEAYAQSLAALPQLREAKIHISERTALVQDVSRNAAIRHVRSFSAASDGAEGADLIAAAQEVFDQARQQPKKGT